jgi:HEAT repeat protein
MRPKTKIIIVVVECGAVALLGLIAGYYWRNVRPIRQADKEFREGLKLYEEGNYRESIERLSATLQRPPEMVPADSRVRAVDVLGLIGAKYWDDRGEGWGRFRVKGGDPSSSPFPVDSPLVGILKASLRDEDAAVRRADVGALAKTGVLAAVKPLAEALKDADVSVRREAVFALATLYNATDLNSQYHPPELRPQVDAADAAVHRVLAAALKDSDPEVRERAAIAFGLIDEKWKDRDHPRAAPLLQEALKDESISVRIYAYGALKRLLWHAFMMEEINRGTYAPMRKTTLHADAVELLSKALEHEDWTVRYKAADVLREIHDASVVGPLHKALQDQHQPVRLAAAQALGQIKDHASIKPLIAALGDADSAVRYRAAEALRDIGEPATEALLTAPDPADSPARLAIALSLGMIQDDLAAEILDRPEDRQSLADALRTGDEAGRQSAAELAGILGDKNLVEPLVAALADEHSNVRYRAAEALGKIGDPAAVEPLIKTLSDPHQAVRVKAAEALGGTKDPQAAEALVEAMKKDDYSLRHYAREALSKIGAPAVPALIANLGYQGPPWKNWADLAGDMVGRPNTGGYLCANEFPIPLGRIGAPAVGPLTKALQNDDPAVQNAALLGLAVVWATSDCYIQVIDILSSDGYVVHGNAMHAFHRGDVWVPSEPFKPLPVVLGIRVCPNLFETRTQSRSLPEIPTETTAAAVDAVIKVLDESGRGGDQGRATDVQQAAVLALGNIQSPKAVDHLLKLVAEPGLPPKASRRAKEDIAFYARRAVETIKARQCVPRLIEAVKDPRLRDLAVVALGQIGDARAIEPLEEALKDEGAAKEFRDRVTKALARIKGTEKPARQRWLGRQPFPQSKEKVDDSK